MRGKIGVKKFLNPEGGHWECHCKYIEENWFGYFDSMKLTNMCILAVVALSEGQKFMAARIHLLLHWMQINSWSCFALWHSLRLNADVADTASQKSLRQFCKYCWPQLNYEKNYIFISYKFLMLKLNYFLLKSWKMLLAVPKIGQF